MRFYHGLVILFAVLVTLPARASGPHGFPFVGFDQAISSGFPSSSAHPHSESQCSLDLHPDESNGTAQICYFSLNREDDREGASTFLNKIQNDLQLQIDQKVRGQTKKVGVRVEIIEGVPDGTESAEEAFQNMVEKMVAQGKHCQGLVITGHHTGAWNGNRVSQSLSLEFLEKLSCDPRYQGWFERICSLHLEGCKTTGFGKIESTGESSGTASPGTVVGNLERLYDQLEEDGLGQTLASLDSEYSNILDRDNPLGTRYLRVFPRATQFTWKLRSPGELTKSERSFPYHIAQLAIMSAEDAALKRQLKKTDPITSKDFDQKVSEAYLLAVLQNLKVLPPEVDPNQCEQQSIDAWNRHGRKTKENPWAFDNPGLAASASLFSQGEKQLLQARNDNCEILNTLVKKESLTPEDRYYGLQLIERVLSNPVSIGYSFSAMAALLSEVRSNENKREFGIELETLLRNSPHLAQYLKNQILNEDLGLTRKIDYFVFMRDLSGESFPKTEEAIRKAAKIYARQEAKSGATEYERDAVRFLKQHLFESLLEHEIVKDSDFFIEVIDDPKTTESTALAVSRAMFLEGQDLPDLSRLMQKLIRSSKTSDRTLALTLSTIRKAQILDKKSENQTPRLADADRLIGSVIDSPRFGSESAIQLSLTVSRPGYSYPGLERAIEKMMSQNVPEVRASVGYLIGGYKGDPQKLPRASQYIGQLAQSSNKEELESAVSALFFTRAKLTDSEWRRHFESLCRSIQRTGSSELNKKLRDAHRTLKEYNANRPRYDQRMLENLDCR